MPTGMHQSQDASPCKGSHTPGGATTHAPHCRPEAGPNRALQLREAFACPRGAHARHVCKLACSPRACAGGDQGFTAWHERLALATRRYSKVMMVGDSMVRPLLCTG